MLVVEKSSSRVNEEMGRVPIWKIPYLTHEIWIWTHEILLRKKRKGRKIVGRGKDGWGMGLVTISEEGEHVQLSHSEENWKMNLFLGTRIVGKHFLTELINEIIENMSDWGITHCWTPCLVEKKKVCQVPMGREE